MVHAIMVLGSDTGISSLLLLCLAARFLGRPYEYSEVLDETLGAEVLQQQRMAGLP